MPLSISVSPLTWGRLCNEGMRICIRCSKPSALLTACCLSCLRARRILAQSQQVYAAVWILLDAIYCMQCTPYVYRTNMYILCRLVQRKTLLLAGQVICAASAASFSFVIFLKTPTAFLCVCLALRVVNGIGSAAVDTSSFAIISRQDAFPAQSEERHVDALALLVPHSANRTQHIQYKRICKVVSCGPYCLTCGDAAHRMHKLQIANELLS